VVVLQFTLINAFSWAAFFVLGPFVAKSSLGGPAAWGLILTAEAAGMLLGGFIAMRHRPRRPLLVGNLGILLIAVPLAALALGWHVAPVALAAFVAGVGVEFFEVNWATTLQQEIPTDKLSRVSSYDWLGSFALVPLGTVLVGPLAAAIGLSATLWVASGIVLSASLATLAVGDVRRLTSREDAEPVEAERIAALAA
jgi:hypothetical protein